MKILKAKKLIKVPNFFFNFIAYYYYSPCINFRELRRLLKGIELLLEAVQCVRRYWIFGKNSEVL